MIPNGLANFYTIDDATRKKIYELGQLGGSIMEKRGEPESEDNQRKWGVGEVDFEALMRMLDNAVSLLRSKMLCKKHHHKGINSRVTALAMSTRNPW
jgi:hypothetical protein